MTPAEEMVFKATLQYEVHKSMNDGIMAAVQMIRIAAVAHPDMTMQQLADAIESTATKDQPIPPSFFNQ